MKEKLRSQSQKVARELNGDKRLFNLIRLNAINGIKQSLEDGLDIIDAAQEMQYDKHVEPIFSSILKTR